MNATKTTGSEMQADHALEGRGVSGVTYDGSLVWLVDRYENHLLGVDPETEAVERRLSGLKITSGLTFDGDHLWGLAVDTLLEIDPKSGEVLHSVEVPAGGSGLAWAEGYVWMGRFAEKELMKIDPRSGEVQKTVQSDRLVTGVTWIDGELWHGAWEHADEDRAQVTEVRRLDPATSEVVERVEVEAGFLTSGVEADGSGRFWCGDSVSGRLCAVRPI